MSTPTAKYIGGRIYTVRREQQLTRAEVGRRVGLTESQVRRVEDTGRVFADELTKIAAVLGKNPGWFMRDIADANQPEQQTEIQWETTS